MKAIYVAEDNTQFDNKYDCERYEEQLIQQKIDRKIMLFSAEGKELEFNCDNLDICFYVYLKEDIGDEYDYLLDILATYNMPIKKGLYYYEAVITENWIRLDNIINTLTEELKMHNYVKEQCAD